MRYLLAALSIIALATNASAIDQRDLDAYIVKRGGSTVYPELPPALPAPKRPPPETVRVTAYGFSKLVRVGESASSVVAEEGIKAHCHRLAQRTHGGYTTEQSCIDNEIEARENLQGKNMFPAD